jgi:outer membrane protein OmpA-like peptidoglycan-associated protein
VLDPEDVCPDEPQGEHPDPARRGCPLGDRDRDTIYDNVDQCPDQPEDLDGFEDVDGCPDPDNDHDGILDGADRCPLQPETRNEFQEEDGCPDEAPPRAVVVENRITINQRVHFAFDRAEIEAQSFPILDQVVTVLREHPELRRIRVEGHTDEQGGPEHNLPLSRDRARAVVDYLRRHGISRRRMVSEGFGSTRPLVEGRSDEALAQNRRVDFIIVDGASFGASYVPPAGDGRPRRHHRRHH